MLIIAVVPMLLTATLDIRGLSRLGSRLAEQSGRALSDQDRAGLEKLADHYASILQRENQLIELLLRLQKREVERLLRAADPATGAVYFEEAFDNAVAALDLQVQPDKYFRVDPDDGRIPIPVSLTEQVLHLAPGVPTSEVQTSARRLAPLSEFYAEALRHHGDIIYWQYTALENGLHSTFPGHGGYPPDFDARTRPWYVRQKKEQTFLWSRPLVDVSSRLVLTGASVPVYGPDGRFAGVAGIDIHATGILNSLRLPSHLTPASNVLMTFVAQAPAVVTPQILVIARQRDPERGSDWNKLPAMEPFLTDDAADNKRLLDDMLALKSGFLRTSYRGEDVFCVYRSFDDNDPSFLVFLVPTRAVVAPAMAAADYVLQSTRRQIDALVPIVFGLVGVTAVLAFLCARAITGPVNHLSRAVDEAARGNFGVRVDIRTGDELEHLGNAFNAMVPQLEKHAQVRESLALAREVQQNLLPSAAPDIEGVDLAGFSLYCDQTGGDYFDFIDLRGQGKTRIGVAIGDVSGHGIPSALLMATVRALLHGSAQHLASPPEILQHINQHLVADVHGGRFMTLFYLIVDVEDKTLKWASAGHDPAIRYDLAEQVFSELGGNDIPLGIDCDWQYVTTNQDTWRPAEIILLGTDGIWESRSPGGEPFGKDRLREIIRSHAHESADVICKRIVDELTAFRKTRTQRDDVTAVVLRLGDRA